jgi:hypothetical protein
LHYSEERSPLLLSGGAESIDNVDATPSLKVWDLYTMKLRGEFNQHRIQNKEIITIDAKPSSSQSTKAKVSTIATHQWFPYAVSGDDYGTIILWNPHTCKDVVVHRAPVEKKTISSICIIVNKDLIDRDISPTITKYGQSPVKITSETLFAATVIALCSIDKKFSIWDGSMKNLLWQKTTNHTDLLLSITLIYNESRATENIVTTTSNPRTRRRILMRIENNFPNLLKLAVNGMKVLKLSLVAGTRLFDSGIGKHRVNPRSCMGTRRVLPRW